MKARRLITERVIQVWATAKAPDPDTERMAWASMGDQADAAVDRALGGFTGDPFLQAMEREGKLELVTVDTLYEPQYATWSGGGAPPEISQ